MQDLLIQRINLVTDKLRVAFLVVAAILQSSAIIATWDISDERWSQLEALAAFLVIGSFASFIVEALAVTLLSGVRR